MAVSERIKELRGRMTFEEFAKSLGVTASNINAIEKGRSNLSIDLAVKISETYHCSLDWLLKGVGERSISTESQEDKAVREIERKYMKALESLVSQKDEIIALKEQLLEKEKGEKQKAQNESEKL